MSNLSPRQFNYTVDGPAFASDDEKRESHAAVHRVLSRVDPGLTEGHEVWITDHMNVPGRAGEYEHALNRTRIHPDVIEHPQGLMHEMGHRHSAIMGNHHAAYDTPERRQAEEDYAIRYADRHRP